jgi:hypothetical protein
VNEDLITKDMHELYVADPVQKILTVHMRRTALYPKYDSMGLGCRNYRLDTAQKTTIIYVLSQETKQLPKFYILLTVHHVMILGK